VRWAVGKLSLSLIVVFFLTILCAANGYAQETATLTIRSQYGTPDPAVGTWTYTIGTEITAGVETPVSGPTGIRYVCTGWRARGSPDTLPPEGTASSVTFTITMNTTITWRWKTQYLLTTTVTPEGGGRIDVLPTSTDGYYNAKSTVRLEAVPNEGYDFSYWSGGLRGTTNPQDLLLRGPRTVTANFILQKRHLVVSGGAPDAIPPNGIHEYDYGTTVNANCGTIGYTYPGGEGTRFVYVCTGHSGTGNVTDGPETSITFVITVDYSTVTWVPGFQTQYYLIVDSLYGDPVGAGWYDAGTTANWSVTNPWPSESGVRYVTDPASGSVVMDAPQTVTVSWATQYCLTYNSPLGEPVVEGWYNAGTTANWNAISPWSGDPGIQYIADPASGSIVMDAPQSITVTWTTQYQLSIDSAYGDPQGAGWYNGGVTAHWSVTSPWSGGTGIQYLTSPTEGDVLMDSPKTVTVNWITKYYLTVNSLYGDPVGAGWYDAGTTANWSVTSPWPGDPGVRYVTSPMSGSVTMDSPKTVTVTWTIQYYLTVVSAYGAPTGEGWYDSGATATWSVTSPWAGGTGIQYVTSPSSGDVLMDMPKTVTVTWTTQYYLTVSVLPVFPVIGGTVTPASAWYGAGTAVDEAATPSTGFTFSSWTGDPVINPDEPATPETVQITMDAPKSITANFTVVTPRVVTVTSAYGEPSPPVGATTYPDGYAAALSCGPDPYPVGATETRYVCTGWTGGSGDVPPEGTENSYTIPAITQDSAITWTWKTQYCLTIVPGYGDPQGVGWYNPGETANWSVTSPWPGDPGVLYFTDTTSGTVLMDSPQTVTITWVTEYWLTVDSDYGDPQGEDWYGAGETAFWSVTSPWPVDTGVRYVADPASGSVLMDEPKVVTVPWTTQYCLTYNSPQGAPVVEGWYDAGTTANWHATSPWPGDPGIQYIAIPDSGSILMDAPHEITISWQTQYYLTVDSRYGDPQGAGWYNAGVTASWSVTSPWPGDTGVQYVIDPTSGTILMDEPKTLVVVPWITQFQLTTAVDPSDTGSVSPASGSWFNAETVVSCEATPNSGYWFVDWSGDLSGTTNPQNLAMSSPKSVTAHFVLVPVADFTGTPTTGNIPLTVVFTDLSTGPVTSWSWNFGSGASPATASTQGPHSVTYSTVGLKTVTLTVTGPGGSDIETKTDYINALPVVPVADFSATPKSAIVPPLTVQFTDESIGNITSWAWDFDNNGVDDSTERNPSYTYTGTGRYTVKLTVTGPGGSDNEVKTGYIRVCTVTIYVDGLRPNDSGDGLTWATAKKTIQAGLNAASNDWAVRVANGTYSGDLNKNLDFAGKAVHLKSEGGASNCIIGITGTGSTLRRGFYFHTSEGAYSVVEGFKIQNGYSDNGGGGAMVCYGCSPTITNCTITNCESTGEGGGIYCNGSSSEIRNCTITNSTAADNGGGICVTYSSGVKIVGCVVQTNTATTADVSNGGGIHCFESTIKITNCTITGNTTTNWGSGIYCVNCNAKITGCTITNNTLCDSGGGIFYGGLTSSEISNCTISGNSAGYWGGGIFCGMDSAPAITNCTITGNRAYDSGGGILCYKAGPYITNCIIRDNIASNYGGGIEMDLTCNPRITNCTITNNTAANGAGLDLYTRSVPIITNCTIVNNSASTNGGGIFAKCGSTPSIKNTIIWGNTASSQGHQIYTGNSGCLVTLNYCDYADNTLNSNNIAGLGTVTPNNCIVSDPLFVDAGNKNYRLTASSPCINTGNNSYVPDGVTTDLDGNPRIVNGTVDIGAYERQP
jgi:parallel beta-helix repeat protein